MLEPSVEATVRLGSGLLREFTQFNSFNSGTSAKPTPRSTPFVTILRSVVRRCRPRPAFSPLVGEFWARQKDQWASGRGTAHVAALLGLIIALGWVYLPLALAKDIDVPLWDPAHISVPTLALFQPVWFSAILSPPSAPFSVFVV